MKKYPLLALIAALLPLSLSAQTTTALKDFATFSGTAATSTFVAVGNASQPLRKITIGNISVAVTPTWTNIQGKPAAVVDLADGELTGSLVGTGISGTNITTGTVADARIASTLARDSEVTAAIAAVRPPNPLVATLTYAATTNTDSTAADLFNLTLTGNVVLANPTNGIDGRTIKWRIKQDATGSRTVTLGDKFRIPSSTTPPLAWSTAASKTDVLAATYNSADDKWDIVALVPGY